MSIRDVIRYRPVDPAVRVEISPRLAGCWVDGSALYSGSELAAAIIQVAIEFGMPVTEDDQEILDAWAAVRPGVGGTRHADDDLSEALWGSACEAVDYLDGLTDNACHFEISDGLFLIDEDEDLDYPFDLDDQGTSTPVISTL
ncbi:hypothetical protein [Frankia sp. CiP3]|uniref:hypothetical protein n=1 Tax=Frankia sp. CiP3 TaxID=2880971 RepID=UPI001EF6D267|nr:hypothetical protein [Frankia sp. CiP3]